MNIDESNEPYVDTADGLWPESKGKGKLIFKGAYDRLVVQYGTVNLTHRDRIMALPLSIKMSLPNFGRT